VRKVVMDVVGIEQRDQRIDVEERDGLILRRGDR
jgi:hypothetical protein